MRKAIAIVALIAFGLICLPFVVGLFAFRVDSFSYLKGYPKTTHDQLEVSVSAARCAATNQNQSIPGFLAANEKANGFQVEWKLKGRGTERLSIKDIKAELIKQDGVLKPLDVPFDYWYGAHTASKNIHYAFISTGGYSQNLPMGSYRMRLSYTANDHPYTDEFILDYTANRKFGFHTLFYSKYF